MREGTIHPMLILLLNTVFSGASVERLLEYDLTYSDIAILLSEAIEKRLLVADPKLELTNKGQRVLRAAADGHMPRRMARIRPCDEARVEQWSIDHVYVPPRRSRRHL